MVRKSVQYRIQGMNRDLSESAYNIDKSESPFKWAYEIMNMRIVPNSEDNTEFSIVNEKGTELLAGFGLPVVQGIVIGKALIGKYLILFTVSNNEYVRPNIIYKLYYENNNAQCYMIFSGDLNFSLEHPIETVSYYENDKIQKVYWTDGLNQPRVINIENVLYQNDINNSFANEQFNFVPVIPENLPGYTDDTIINIKKIYAGGEFPAGVIQYVFTYSNMYMQETNIFYQSDLYYITFSERGGDGEETIGNVFQITIPPVSNIDNFEYINIYSILRTSIDSTPIVKLVESVRTSNINSMYIEDNGTKGSTVDPTILFYIGGKELIAQTIEHKDNTLFLGNLKENTPNLKDFDWSYSNYYNYLEVAKLTLSYNHRRSYYNEVWRNSLYDDDHLVAPGNERSELTDKTCYSAKTKFFKYGEYYRFGIQFKYKTGEWSEVIYLKDLKNDKHVCDLYEIEDTQILSINVPQAHCCGIPQEIRQRLMDKGFTHVRPVVVYPEYKDRTIICQGILCPTVFNIEDRYNGNIFAMSSWFTRPTYTDLNTTSPEDLQNDLEHGHQEVNKHLELIPYSPSKQCEIQCNFQTNMTGPYNASEAASAGIQNYNHWVEVNPTVNLNNSDLEDYLTFNDCFDKTNNFYVDHSIMTIHSPELEFDESIKNMDLSDVKLRIVGVLPFTAGQSNIYIDAKNTPIMEYNKSPYNQNFNNFTSSGRNTNGGRCLLGVPAWRSQVYTSMLEMFSNAREAYNSNDDLQTFVVYPWHGTYLNNGVGDSIFASKLNRKIESNLRYSLGTQYYQVEYERSVEMHYSNTNPPTWDIVNTNVPSVYRYFRDINISDVKISDVDQFTPLFLKVPESLKDNYGASTISYYGCVDKAITSKARFMGIGWTYNERAEEPYHTFNGLFTGYGFYVYGNTLRLIDQYSDVFTLNNSSLKVINQLTGYYGSSYSKINTPLCKKIRSDDLFTINPVIMRYKSSPHAVVMLGSDEDDRQLIIGQGGANPVAGKKFVWDKTVSSALKYSYILNSPEYPSYSRWNNYRKAYMVELYREVSENIRFGGNTPEAIENNVWVPCGEEIPLTETKKDIVWTEGDTYYQRYDHLKTYSYSEDDPNSIIEVISFKCESRVNLIGRYDKNKGALNLLHITEKNFNLLNPVYSQKKNFLNYRTLNYNKVINSFFSNRITWTKSKVAGELADTWCNVTLASFLDMDGNKGEVRSLNRFRNELLCFQDKGLAKIKFNENAALQTVAGLPVELANSGRVEGKDYISELVGTKNKWAIESTPTGLFFVDGYNKSLYRYEPTQASIPVDIANAMGFITYFRNDNVNNIWEPEHNLGYRLQYDNINGDLFITDKDHCLSFNTRLNCFSSFYSYLGNPDFTNFNDKGIFITRHFNGQGTDNISKIWKEHENVSYDYIFGNGVDSYIDFIVNPSPHTDKIFDTVEFRNDRFSILDGSYIADDTIQYIRAYNEYQDTGEVFLSQLGNVNAYHYGVNIPSNLKKKFRMWRVNIPRDKKNKYSVTNRDRIRNPWTHIKLTNHTIYKNVLNDIIVHYFE